MPKLLTEARPSLSATPVEGKPGRFLIQLISPGWGSSGYYSPDVLKAAGEAKVFPAGMHQYLDHPTRTEEYDRPERSVRDLAAVLAEDARWDDGLQALVAEASVFGAHRDMLEQMADDIGVSIRAYAESKPGEAEGRHGVIITSLEEGISADYVTHAGRGGKVLQVLESARARIAEAVSDKPWSDFSDSDYTDEQYARACVLDRGPDAGTAKERYGLRVKEPDGTLNRNGVHAAASRLGSVKNATADQKKAAAKKLVSLYRNQLDEDPPDSLLKAAGMKTSEATANDTRDALQSALVDVYGGEKSWVSVRDFDDETVWFCQYTPDSDATYAQGYSLASDGGVSLTGEPTEVRAVTTYVPVARPGSTTEESINPKETPMGTIQVDEAEHRRLTEEAGRVQTLESERDAAVQRAEAAESERDQARATIAEQERAATVSRILDEAREAANGVELDEFQTAGITSRAVNADDGSLDEKKTREAFDTAIAKLAEKAGHGKPRGLGGPIRTTDPEPVEESGLDELDALAFGGVAQEA